MQDLSQWDFHATGTKASHTSVQRKRVLTTGPRQAAGSGKPQAVSDSQVRGSTVTLIKELDDSWYLKVLPQGA